MELRKYGCVPDVKDPIRDLPYKMSGKVLPPMSDLRPKMPPVYAQLALGSCVSNGVGAAIEYNFHIMNHPDFMPSRLFIYFNGRVVEHTVKSDSGLQIRDGIKVVAKYGVCPESMWGYDIKKFTSKPLDMCYAAAAKDVVTRYKRLTSLTQYKDAIASGYPVIFGFSVYESFESDAVAKTGIVPMPKPGEQLMGGHCVLAVGYNDHTQRVIVRNSWGNSCGIKGYCEMPYEYFNSDLVSDCWTIFYVE